MAAVDLQDLPLFPIQLIYDPANGVNKAATPGTSLVARAPAVLEYDGLTTGTTLAINVRLTPTSAWKLHSTLDGAVATFGFVTFDPRFNFVQLVRTGAAEPVVSVQHEK